MGEIITLRLLRLLALLVGPQHSAEGARFRGAVFNGIVHLIVSLFWDKIGTALTYSLP